MSENKSPMLILLLGTIVPGDESSMNRLFAFLYKWQNPSVSKINA